MNRLQIRKIGPYPHGFSLNSPAIRLKSMRTWPRFSEFSLRFSKSDRLLGFEFTHELARNVLKDYLEEVGVAGIIGSKGATREAFRNGLIEDGEAWMEMIKARNLSSHTYNQETADEVVENILTCFYPAFEQLTRKFTALATRGEND